MTTATTTISTISLPAIPSSSVAKSPFAFSLSNMFQCGCDPSNVEDVPMIYQQASYDSACAAAAVDDEAFYYNHVVKHNNQTYHEQPHRSTKDYFQHLPINSEMQGAIIIPTSPITSQQQRAQQQQPLSIPSNKSLDVTPVTSIEVTPVSSNRTLVTVTPDKVAAQRFHPPNRIKHTVSNVTESTHSMSDDEMSIEEEASSQHDDTDEDVVTVRKPLVSILRKKPEDTTSSRRIIQSPSRTHTETRVQFAATTNLVNPAQRQHVPRLSTEARYAYAYQAGWLSATQERSFLQAVRNPKTSPLKITTTTNSAVVDVRQGACIASSPHHADVGPERQRFQQRLERRKGQNQYLYRTHNTIGAAFASSSSPSPYMCKYGAPHPTTTVSSTSYATKKHHPTLSSASYTAAEELLLSQLNYNDNSGFYVFR